MKKITLLLIAYFVCVTTSSQTIFTFSEVEDELWTNQNNWTPSYPGRTINENDTVIIPSGNTVQMDSYVSNNGVLINNGSIKINDYRSGFTNNGLVNNNNEATFYNNGIQFKNNIDAILNNYGEFKHASTPVIYNYGIISNYNYYECFGSVFNFSTGEIANENTIYHNDQFKNEGTLKNNGTIDFGQSNVDNYGEIINNNLIVFQDYIERKQGYFSNLEEGIFFNNGTLSLFSSSNIGFFKTTTPKITHVYGHVPNLNIYYIPDPEENIIFDIYNDGTYDSLWVKSGVLNNILTVRVPDEFNPDLGNEYQIIYNEENTLEGEFNEINLPDLANGKSFEIIYNYDNPNYSSVILKVVSSSTLDTVKNTISENSFIYHDKIKKELNIKSSLKGNIKVYDLKGNLIYQNKIYSGTNKISTLEFAVGVYLVAINNMNSHKIFIQ